MLHSQSAHAILPFDMMRSQFSRYTLLSAMDGVDGKQLPRTSKVDNSRCGSNHAPRCDVTMEETNW